MEVRRNESQADLDEIETQRLETRLKTI